MSASMMSHAVTYKRWRIDSARCPSQLVGAAADMGKAAAPGRAARGRLGGQSRDCGYDTRSPTSSKLRSILSLMFALEVNSGTVRCSALATGQLPPGRLSVFRAGQVSPQQSVFVRR